MPKDIPIFISILFLFTTLLTLLFFYYALRHSSHATIKSKANLIVIVLSSWLIIQAIVAFNNFYLDTTSLPPKLLLAVVPTFIVIILLFAIKQGRVWIDSLPLKALTYLHVVRIPVELVLYFLFLHRAVPELMTFTGRNFDIVAGISAPILAYLAFTKKRINKKVVLIWNFISLALLLNIVIHAILSAPFPLQQLAFEQPNVAILHFPFVWLPTFIVPIVLFSHLVAIRQLSK